MQDDEDYVIIDNEDSNINENSGDSYESDAESSSDKMTVCTTGNNNSNNIEQIANDEKNTNNNNTCMDIVPSHWINNNLTQDLEQLPLVKKAKSGDVAKEKVIEDRMKQLGLWENKLKFENSLLNSLHQRFHEDKLIALIDRCKRKRPLRDIPSMFQNDIVNVIQTKLICNKQGQKEYFCVDIMMGMFTHNVRYSIEDDAVKVVGSTNEKKGKILLKEISIQFPDNVDISNIQATFSAGRFKCQAPFYKDISNNTALNNQDPYTK